MSSSYAVWQQVRRLREFTVTQQHLELLRKAYICWNNCDFGAPEVDPKRPYGNSDVLVDIAEILFEPAIMAWDDETREQWIDEHEERLTRLHVETALALQICLKAGGFRPGRYHDLSCGEWVGEALISQHGRDVEGRTQPEAIRWYTPDGVEAVREWLGDAYVATRGGLQEDDPYRVWFLCDAPGSERQSWIGPGDWLVRQRDGGIAVMSDEDYRNAG